MSYLEKISPSYYDILIPLKEWRILSVADLKIQSGHNGSLSSFYKIVSKLEKNSLIESFINCWSNEKFIYLRHEGISLLSEEKSILPINKDQRFHDAICSKVAIYLKSFPIFKKIHLDHNISKHFPLMERTPDILVEGELNKAFNLAFEIELTQKSQTRIEHIFKSYSESKVINNVIYITDKRPIFNFYQEYLKREGGKLNTKKFIFIFDQDLNVKNLNLINSQTIYEGRETTLKEMLKI